MAAAAARKPSREPQSGDTVIISVKLRSGAFESTIEVPIGATKAEFDQFKRSWLAMMMAGIEAGRNTRRKP